MGRNRTNFSTKVLEGYVVNKEIDRPGFEYVGFFDGNHVYKKKKDESISNRK